ncbi:MAG: hypothetical protein OIN88_04635 [Candidatus Methanoperedens sp.]|nr:hypothetical protein [Candidatus Methanoperedens sp.]
MVRTRHAIDVCFHDRQCLVGVEFHRPLEDVGVCGIVYSQDIPVDHRVMAVDPFLDRGQDFPIA